MAWKWTKQTASDEKGNAPAATPVATAGPGRKKKTPGAAKIRTRELPIFSRMVAAMLDSGIPLVQTLSALAEQTNSRVFKSVLEDIRQRIEGGAEFSASLAEYPDVFDELYVSMMRAGEAGGMLAEISSRLARYLESSAKLRRKVRSAMMYPLVVMAMALTIATGMIIFLVPIFSDIYEDFGGDLPGPTQFLVLISDLIRGHALVVVGVIAALVIGFNRFSKTETGALLRDRVILRFPMVGELATKICMGRFSSTFAQLIHGGVPILSALDIVASATGNRIFGAIILKAKRTVEGGELLSEELARHKEFPRMLVYMLTAGEKTGKMDEMLQKVADFYEDEVDAALSGLTSIIEPLLMIFLGLVVGGIVLGMFMPIFRMTDMMEF